MKKTKLILSILAATATLAMASVATGCKVKEWFCEHSYDDGVVVKEATCAEEGEVLFTCDDCGKEYTESVEVIPHTYDSGAITTEPTCTETGIRTYTCTVCAHEKTEVVAKAEHTAKTVAAVAATCETVGYTEWSYCADCNAVLVPKKEIAALGHTEVADKAVAATCTTAGKTAGSHCGTCGETLTAQTVVQALGHTPVTVAGKSPTCTETGLTNGSKCETCGEVFTAQTEIAALGHTDGAVCETCGFIPDLTAFVSNSDNYDLVEVSVGESAIGNVYRIYDNYPEKVMEGCPYQNLFVLGFSNDLNINEIPPSSGLFIGLSSSGSIWTIPEEYAIKGEDEYGTYTDYYIFEGLEVSLSYSDGVSGTYVFTEDVTITVATSGHSEAKPFKLVPKTAN